MNTLVEAFHGVQAVDHHCHPLWRWTRGTSPLDLRSMFTEALDPRIPADHLLQTVGYRDALRRIGAELGCAPTEEAILRARRQGDPEVHANRLMERSGTGVLLMDTGYASSETFTLAEQVKAIRLPQYEIVRLEVMAEQLVQEAKTAADWFSVVRSKLGEAKKSGAVGVKTVAAYRAGLELRPVDRGDAQADFARLRSQAERREGIRLAGAPLVHSLLFEAAEECRDLGLPLQVHCGFGDPDEDLAQCSPLGLRPLFTDPRYDGLQVILLHCYPYHREAAYLCSVFGGVFMDLSLTLPLAGLDGGRAMKEALGLCPWSKLLYASDASRLPEYFFVAAAVHREALAAAFSDLVQARILTPDEAVAAGTQILATNARALYRLS